jgi:thioredoxin-like negative regulator of GroEL
MLDQFDFHSRLTDTTGTALVTFTAPNCGACRHLRHVLREISHLQPDWHLFEVDAQRDPGLCNEFEVFHLPAIFLFQDGHFHCELQAEARPSSIIGAIAAALQRPAAEAP